MGTASEKLYWNTFKHALRQEISNRQKWQRNKRPLDILVAYSNSDDNAFKLLFIHLIWFVKVTSVYCKTSFLISLTTNSALALQASTTVDVKHFEDDWFRCTKNTHVYGHSFINFAKAAVKKL